MFSKRIPVAEKLAGVTGRPRRWADRSRSSTFSLARDRATPSPPARVPVHIHLQRWFPLDGAAPAGTAAPSAHPGLCQWPHQLRRGWKLHSWAPQVHLTLRRRPVWISSAPEFFPSQALAQLSPRRAYVPAESHPAQKRKQSLLSRAISKHPGVPEPAGCGLPPIRRRPAVRPVLVGLVVLLQRSCPAPVPYRKRSRPQASPREHPDGRKDPCPAPARP